MKLIYSVLLLLSIFFSGQLPAIASPRYLLTYPAAPYDTPSSTFALRIGETTIPISSFYNGRYDFGHLAFEGAATFVLSLRSGAQITGYNISPHALGIKATVKGSDLIFTVTQRQSTYLIITITTASGTLEPMVLAGDRKEIGAPTIGGSVHDITAPPYGADKSGNNLLNTTIQRAIDSISASGGGTIYFPAGVYKISNNIRLASNITIYLAAGAFLRGSPDRSDYIWNARSTTTAGDPKQGPQNFVIPGGTVNVAFAGRGMIDGNSTVLVTPQSLGGTIDGWGGYRKGIIHSGNENGAGRPTGIRISDVTIKDATTWTVDIQDAQNVTIQSVKMVNDFQWIHSDGYDLSNVTTATVDNCLGITGDDVFDAKSSNTNPLSDIVYSNGVAYSFKGTGTKIGVQATGAARNVTFSNIQVVAGQRAVSVSHDSGTGVWNGLNFRDIHMENLEGTSSSGQFLVAPIVIWTMANGGGPVSNVSLSRVTVEDSGGQMSQISGATSAGSISNVTLREVSIDGELITKGNYQSKIAVGTNVKDLRIGNDILPRSSRTIADQHE
jgi:hypothetical protein